MSQHTMPYTRCDGCGKTTLPGPQRVEMVKHRLRVAAIGAQTVDICNQCAEQDRYICQHCWGVHDDAHPCEAVKRMIEEVQHADQHTLEDTHD